MLRIHFTTDDLLRTRVVTGPDPLWEVLLSLHMLAWRDAAPVFGQWRRQVRASLDRSAGMLLRLAPPRGYSPDFLTPTAGAVPLEQAVDQVLSAPGRRLSAELSLLAMRRPPAWIRGLADTDPELLRLLGGAIHTYFERALRPHWNHIRSRVDADRAARGRFLLDGGPEHVLATLHPTVRWHGDVLEATYPVDKDVYLNGRGLRLIPSFFCWGSTVTLHDSAYAPVLAYPIAHELGWAEGPSPTPVADRRRPVGTLLGRTRAAVLECISQEGTTGDLARRLGISPASASEHAAILRDAGLSTAWRDRNTVRHVITPLGLAVLNGGRTLPIPAPHESSDSDR